MTKWRIDPEQEASTRPADTYDVVDEAGRVIIANLTFQEACGVAAAHNMHETVDQAAKVIWETSRADEGTISGTGAAVIALALADAGLLATEGVSGAGVSDTEDVSNAEVAAAARAMQEENAGVLFRYLDDDHREAYYVEHLHTYLPLARAALLAARTVRLDGDHD